MSNPVENTVALGNGMRTSTPNEIRATRELQRGDSVVYNDHHDSHSERIGSFYSNMDLRTVKIKTADGRLAVMDIANVRPLAEDEAPKTQQQILAAASLDELRKCWRAAVAKSDDESLSDRARRVADEIADDVRAEIQKRGEMPNPIEKTVALRKYPGWEVYCYADGTFAASNGVALSPVEDTFQDAVYFAKHGETKPKNDGTAPMVAGDQVRNRTKPQVPYRQAVADAAEGIGESRKDTRVLYRWSPAQIAEMDAAQAQGVIDFHTANPPTMDYMTEFNRSMTEMRLAKARLAELVPADGTVSAKVRKAIQEGIGSSAANVGDDLDSYNADQRGYAL